MESRFSTSRRVEIRAQVWFLTVLIAASLPASPAAAAGPARVKLATAAPRGTSLHRVLQEMAEKWRRAPGGGVDLVIYPDGVMGGEAEVVRRMRVGQIQAAMLSVQGLSEIDDSVTSLQNMPFMFRSLDEVEFIREKLHPTLEKRFAGKGFVVLFWGDVGWVRFFSKDPGVRPADFKKMKLFTWAGNNEQVELMKALGFQPVPLETNDILPGLQTGLIDVIPTAPLIALAGQFYGPAPHMLEVDYAPLVGGTVILKKTWDAIPAETREALMKAAAEAGEEVTIRNRTESDQAVEAMKKRGLKVHALSPEFEAEWRALGESVYPRIRGLLVPADMFDEVERLLRDYRARGGKAR